MGRRSLVVGGGAAALAAVTGAVTPARANGRAVTASEHARQVLRWVDVGRGLGDLEQAKIRLADGFAHFEASPPRDPRADDLHAWIQRRFTDLTGKTDPFENVIFQDPQTRPLLAFFFVVHNQHPELPLPAIERGMPVPPIAARLEAGFFPAFATELAAESLRTPAFGDLMRAGDTELERILTELADAPSTKARPSPEWTIVIGLACAAIGTLELLKGKSNG